MKTFPVILLLSLTFSSYAQDNKNIVRIIDDLTKKWNDEAAKLSTYEGLKKYCSTKTYRDQTTSLLDEIHHYDTLLHSIVTKKYDTSNDEEAKLTLKDIETLETDYTTQNFKAFIHRECNGVNDIERNYGRKGGNVYKKETKKLEKELSKYVESITARIDIIDEHVHHLKLDKIE